MVRLFFHQYNDNSIATTCEASKQGVHPLSQVDARLRFMMTSKRFAYQPETSDYLTR